MGKTRETISVFHFTQNTKRRKELSVLHLTETIHKLKIFKKLFFHGKYQEKNICIAFDSDIQKAEKNSLCCI